MKIHRVGIRRLLSKPVCIAPDHWESCSNKVTSFEERLMRIASDAGLLLPREPNGGTVKLMGPFMKKYGFVNANGWWIKH
ncbi:hypothetical protein [Anaerolactibacter massiliensis]|uniref:hypothetical protein n=1 Tax=Anaerolactibacter massiliensis TaxID=2044573 RepID=UPI00107EFA26|nr:hypothetical protein [Anaerolactibacter massiliensis]MDD7680287.1 hypothetical protein [Stecheria intestinalis]